MDRFNYWKVTAFTKVIIPPRKERNAYMEDCAEYFQGLLLKIGYIKRGSAERRENQNDSEDMDMDRAVDE